ncbi:MAG: hypothetical protein K0Q56_1584 [Sporolactobacillus laevolacticus]|nr:hypothetical protein [Sporolactobacillus laevolacticus]
MSAYEHYSATYLTGLYHSIKQNIENGFLSNAMVQELSLIAEAVNKQGVVILEERRAFRTFAECKIKLH